jgi:hypothetical protein
LSRSSVLFAVALLAILGLSVYPSAFAWSSQPQITYSTDASQHTILTIQFDFSQMSDPPSAGHYPTDFQVRTSTDGNQWTELPAVPITSRPSTTVFSVTYDLGQVSGTVQVQARLRCNVHGWSNWGPDPGIPVPELQFGAATVASLMLVSGLLLVHNRSQVQA